MGKNTQGLNAKRFEGNKRKIEAMYQGNEGGIFSEEENEIMKDLETKKEKVEERVSFFQNNFKEPEGCPIQEILEVLGFFPRIV